MQLTLSGPLTILLFAVLGGAACTATQEVGKVPVVPSPEDSGVRLADSGGAEADSGAPAFVSKTSSGQVCALSALRAPRAACPNVAGTYTVHERSCSSNVGSCATDPPRPYDYTATLTVTGNEVKLRGTDRGLTCILGADCICRGKTSGNEYWRFTETGFEGLSEESCSAGGSEYRLSFTQGKKSS